MKGNSNPMVVAIYNQINRSSEEDHKNYAKLVGYGFPLETITAGNVVVNEILTLIDKTKCVTQRTKQKR